MNAIKITGEETANRTEVKIYAIVKKINECPDCNGRGRIVKNWRRPNVTSICPTCGGEPDDASLIKRGKLWYKAQN